MFQKIVAVEPVNLLPAAKERLHEFAKEVVLYDSLPADDEEIIRRVYREPYANRFLASFAPFIRAHIDRPEIRELVLRSFRDFASRNLSRYPAELPVSLLGGVAAHFEALLREALEAEGRRVETIVESPAEGLLKYHYGR